MSMQLDEATQQRIDRIGGMIGKAFDKMLTADRTLVPVGVIVWLPHSQTFRQAFG